MTSLIELHDRNIRISSPQGLLLQSPGFANTASKVPVFGKEAQEITRLHPQENFNQFWFQLSLDPLVNKNKHFRHQADLAYGHLNSLLTQLKLAGEAIFAVPSHYSPNQLATLLGLVKHCPVDAAGLVDLSLLALAQLKEHQHSVFMDVQLHQIVLTRASRHEGEIVREKVISVPGAGLLALQDAWVNTITDAFIKQGRFDPLHNADTEQYMYNELQNWLSRLNSEQEILLEINNKGTIYQANLSLKNIEQRAQNIYKRVAQELDAMALEDRAVFALARFAEMPGITQALPDIQAVPEERLAENAYEHLNLIKAEADAIKLVARLPLSQGQRPMGYQTPAKSRPSHFLYQHKAYALPKLDLPELKLSTPIRVSLQEQCYWLHNIPELDLQLNGAPVNEPAILKVGDCLKVNNNLTIEFIQVQ
jgi:hypothetical protein